MAEKHANAGHREPLSMQGKLIIGPRRFRALATPPFILSRQPPGVPRTGNGVCVGALAVMRRSTVFGRCVSV